MQNIHQKTFSILFGCVLLTFIFTFAKCKEDEIPYGTGADFAHFEFYYMTDLIKTATIDKQNKKISANIYENADLNSLRPVFVLSHGATAYIDDVKQISGETANDFSTRVTYRIVSENGKVVNFYEVDLFIIPQQQHEEYIVVFNRNTKFTSGTYIMPNHTVINENLVFVIDPGVVLKFPAKATVEINSNVTFLAKGTNTNKIKFTSIDETNNLEEYWGGFKINSATEIEFEHCIIENAGNSMPLMEVNKSKIGLLRSELKNIRNTCILLNDSSMFRIFDHNQFTNITLDENSNPIHFKNINDVTNFGRDNAINIPQKGIYIENCALDKSITLMGQTCPYIFATDITSTTPFITFFIGDGSTIMLKGNRGIDLSSNEILFKVEGTQENKVVFKPEFGASSWNGIKLSDVLMIGSSMNHFIIENAGNSANSGAIRLSKTTPEKLSIRNFSITNPIYHGIYIEKNSDARIENSSFNGVKSEFSDIHRE